MNRPILVLQVMIGAAAACSVLALVAGINGNLVICGLAVVTAFLTLIVAIGVVSRSHLRAVRQIARNLVLIEERTSVRSSAPKNVVRELKKATRTERAHVSALSNQTHEALDSLGSRLGEFIDRRMTSATNEIVANVERRLETFRMHGSVEMAMMSQLVGTYSPSRPIGSRGPQPSSVVDLLSVLTVLEPRSVLAVEMGEQVLWLGHALPKARITSLESPDFSGEIRRDVAVHGFNPRLEVIASPLIDVNIPHFYDLWHDTASISGQFDAIVVGACTKNEYPVGPLLGPFLSSSGRLLVIGPRDAMILQSWSAMDYLVFDEEASRHSVTAFSRA